MRNCRSDDEFNSNLFSFLICAIAKYLQTKLRLITANVYIAIKTLTVKCKKKTRIKLRYWRVEKLKSKNIYLKRCIRLKRRDYYSTVHASKIRFYL